jgi:predicted small lipoprotein YifL
MLRMPALLLFVLTLALAGCGNKGPLVLPDKTPEQQQQDKDKKKDQPADAAQPAPQASTDASANQH